MAFWGALIRGAIGSAIGSKLASGSGKDSKKSSKASKENTKNTQNPKKASSARVKIVAEHNIQESDRNAEDIKSAAKNNQFISDSAKTGSVFLNNINRSINENIFYLEPSTAEQINQNLTDIKNLVSNYIKASIDRQDTDIKDKASDKKVETKKASKADEKKTKSEDKSSILDWLKWLLPLGILGGLIKFWNWLNEFLGFDTRIWNKLGAFLGALLGSKTLRSLFTSPIKWFMNNILPKIKNKIVNSLLPKITSHVKTLIGDVLSKIPGLEKAKEIIGGIKDYVGDKAKTITEAVKGGTKTISTASNTFKSGVLKYLKKIPGAEAAFDKFVEIAKKSADIMKRIGKKVLYIMKGVGKGGKTVIKGLSWLAGPLIRAAVKGALRALGAVASFILGPVGALLSLAFMAWAAFDIFWYMLVMHREEKMGVKFIPALIYAFIGWDLLDKGTKDAWDKIPEVDDAELSKLTNNLTDDNIKSASSETIEQYKAQLKKEGAEYSANAERLRTNKITYKDANGNLLSDEDSSKIQALQLEQFDLRSEKSRLIQERIDKRDKSKYLDGEVEISAEPEKFQKMADYWFDKVKESTSASLFGLRANFSVDIPKFKAERDTYLEEKKKALEKGDIVGASRYQGWADFFSYAIKLGETGAYKTWGELYKAIKMRNAYTTINERLTQINQQIENNYNQISHYGAVSEASSTTIASGSVSPSAGADLSGTTTFSDVQSAIASGSGTSRAVAAANYAWANAKNTRPGDGRGKPYGACAKYVNDAIVNAGYKNYGRGHGYQVGQSLMNIGWRPLLSGESLKVGDVACIGKFPDHQYGHAAILTPGGWVSDFKQEGGHPNGAYNNETDKRNAAAVTTIYRDPGNSSMNVRTSLSNKVLRGPSISAGGGADFGGGSSTQSQAPIVIANNVTNNPVVNNVTSSADLTDYWSLLP